MKSKRELLVKSFVQNVSSPITFNKRYKTVCQLLDCKPVLTQQQWIYVWRGLYYSIWYTEMGKGCELLAKKIASHQDVNMIYAGFKSVANDWFGIDFFRIDKFMFLVRHMINNAIRIQLGDLIVSNNQNETSEETIGDLVLKSDANESDEEIPTLIPIEDELAKDDNEIDVKMQSGSKKKKFKNKSKTFNRNKKLVKHNDDSALKFDTKINAIIIDNILNRVKSSLGLTLHINDIYVEELAKVMRDESVVRFSDSAIKANVIVDMFVPYIKLLATNGDNRVDQSIKEEIFDKFKKEFIIGESIELRKCVLSKLIDAMFAYGSDERVGKRNRAIIYNLIRLYKIKFEILSSEDVKHVRKRKIVEKIGKRKIVKYETTSNTPFVRSIVPIAVL